MSDVQTLIDSLAQENFDELAEDLLGDLSEEELEHWGVLGMKWGVRKDRGTGKKQGTPAKGTPRAKQSAPSISPSPKGKKAKITNVPRKTASPDGETSLPITKSAKRIGAKLDPKQQSKLGASGLELEDFSIDQLRTAADRMKLESEITKMLEGPSKDQAMQAVVNRIKLEQEYKRLTAIPPNKRQKALKKTTEILASVAETQIKAGLNAVIAGKRDQLLKEHGLIGDKDKKKKKK